jgi:hypothetical protein
MCYLISFFAKQQFNFAISFKIFVFVVQGQGLILKVFNISRFSSLFSNTCFLLLLYFTARRPSTFYGTS